MSYLKIDRRPEPNVAEAVRHETRSLPKILISGLAFETLVYGNVVVQRRAWRKPTIHSDGRVTVTWHGQAFPVRAERCECPATNGQPYVWYHFTLDSVRGG